MHMILTLNFMFQSTSPNVKKSLSHKKHISFTKKQLCLTSTETLGNTLRVSRVWQSMKHFVNIKQTLKEL